MVRVVKSHSDLRIKVTGHTDAVGSNIYNVDLSERRAKSITNFFTTSDKLNTPNTNPMRGANGSTRKNLSVGTFSMQRGGKRRVGTHSLKKNLRLSRRSTKRRKHSK